MDRGDDALLVVRAQLGERQALAELVGRWHTPVWRYVRRMVDGPGQADDVSQDVWADVLKALPRLHQPERFAPWLYTIARRAVLDHLRHRYGSPTTLDTDRPRTTTRAAYWIGHRSPRDWPVSRRANVMC